MNYADPFGVQEATPLSRALRHIELTADQTLNWPTGYYGPDYLASINVVYPSAAGFSVQLPSAIEANEGTGFLMVNKGLFAFDVRDFNGTVLTTLTTGQSKYLYCVYNDTDAGTWYNTTFGEGTSQADAVQLAGEGLTVSDGKLATGMSVSTTASNIAIDKIHRGKLMVNNGGSIDVMLPQYTTLDNTFYFALHNGGSGTVNIKPADGNTIDDYPNLALAPNESVFVCCSGTSKWYSIGYGRSTQFQFTKLIKDVSTGGTINLTSAESSNKLLQFTGTPNSDVTIVVPAVVGIYYVHNTYSGPYTLTIKTQAGSGLALSAGNRAILYCDGVDVVSAQSVAVGVNLSVVDGSLNSPSISFSSDPNTGIYRADFDTLGIVSNGQELARFGPKSGIFSSFGIGGINPQAQLHVLSDNPEVFRVQSGAMYPYISVFSKDGYMGYIQGGNKFMFLSTAMTDGAVALQTNGVTKLEARSDRVTLKVPLYDLNNNQFASLAENVFKGLQVLPVQRGVIYQIGDVISTVNIDTTKANVFTMTVKGPTTLNFVNKPLTGQEQTIYVKITNGGANVTYGSMCVFSNSGQRPVLTANGVDVLAVWYDAESLSFVVGHAYRDYRG